MKQGGEKLLDITDTFEESPKEEKKADANPKKPKTKTEKTSKRKKKGEEKAAVQLSKNTVLNLDEFHRKIPANKNAKDSIFLDLFGQKEYLLQLYQVMHPEDKTTTKEDLRYITINRVLLRGIYNDLGFMAGNTLMLLVEAQSTWTMNIIPRVLIYLAHSLQSYFKATDASIYSSTQVYIPNIELYVLFTCDEAKGMDTLSLSEEFFDGKKCDVEVKVHVLYREIKEFSKDADIIEQYTAFTKIFDLCVQKFGRTTEAVDCVINICQNKEILTQYLRSREEEVKRTMLAIFEQEEAEAIDRRNFRKEVTAEVTAELNAKNKEKTKENAIMLIRGRKISLDEVSLFFPQLSEKDIEAIKKEIEL